MAYPDKLYRCNINSQYGGEIVVNTLWVQEDQASVLGPDVSAQTIADRVRDAWSTMILTGYGTGGGMQTQFKSAALFTSVDCYAVDSEGKATAQASAAFAPTISGTGGSGLPPQVALVVTLLTGVPGRSGRGRMFLGNLAYPNALVSGRVAPEVQASVARNIAGFLTAVRDDPLAEDDFRPVVVSPTTSTARKITSVSVGNVYDTMRSRRNKLVEARVTASVDE